jgi:hypothetical protein
MPAQVPPEGVRYAWSFSIGGRQYQLQAKRTNLSSITTLEDPMGHAAQVRDGKSFFQLRGACVTNYFGTPGTAVAGCYHLAFLNGSFDVASRTVTIDLPYNTRDSIGRLVAPDFVPGARLEPLDTAGMSISAGLQGVVTIATINSFINGWNPYTAGRRVDLAIGRAGLAPAGLDYRFPATLSGDAFTGSVGGLNATNDTVYVRACTAVTCHYTSVPA